MAIATTIVLAEPIVLAVGIAAAVGITLFRYASGRLAIFIIGGLVAMGGDAGLGPAKLAYAAFVLACFAVSCYHISRQANSKWATTIRAANWATLLLLGVSVGAVIIGAISNRGLAPIGQDAFTYFLIAAAPMIGLEAGLTSRLRSILLIAAVAGIVAAVGWSAWWLARRGSSIGGIEHVALVTSFLGFAVFAVGIVMMINLRSARGRLLWAGLVIAIPIIYIVAGSRSMIVFLLGLFGMVGLRRHGRVNVSQFAIIGLSITGVALAVIAVVIPVLPDGEGILRRFTRTIALINADSLLSDGSAIERGRAYEYAAAYFLQSPIFGQGFGLIYPSVSGNSIGDLKVDTPLLITAKFGIVGAACIAIALILVWWIIRLNRGPSGLRLGEMAFWAFAWASLARSIFVAPTEEKGFAYSIALLIAMAIAASRDPASFRVRARAAQYPETVERSVTPFAGSAQSTRLRIVRPSAPTTSRSSWQGANERRS